MKISDRVPPFFIQPPVLPSPPILWKNLISPFWEEFENSIPLLRVGGRVGWVQLWGGINYDEGSIMQGYLCIDCTDINK